MSHLSKIELVINDLEVLQIACRHLRMTYSPKVSTADKFQETEVGVDTQTLPKASTAGNEFQETEVGGDTQTPTLALIAVPGARRFIGVQAEGESAFALRSILYAHDQEFQIVSEAIGRLKQRYAVERVLAEARKKNMRIQEMATETGVRLVLTAY